MTLKDYYYSLPERSFPKTEFIEEVAKKCGVRTGTVRNWVQGRRRPQNADYIKILCEVTGLNEEQLFVD